MFTCKYREYSCLVFVWCRFRPLLGVGSLSICYFPTCGLLQHWCGSDRGGRDLFGRNCVIMFTCIDKGESIFSRILKARISIIINIVTWSRIYKKQNKYYISLLHAISGFAFEVRRRGSLSKRREFWYIFFIFQFLNKISSTILFHLCLKMRYLLQTLQRLKTQS